MQDLAKIKTVKDFESEIYADYEISHKLQAGWVLVAIRTIRELLNDGGFADKLIYTLGHESENP
jgi:hypothetical protein